MDQSIQTSTLERVLKRDRAVVLVALLAASLLAWSYIGSGIGMDMDAITMPEMPMPADWTLSYLR